MKKLIDKYLPRYSFNEYHETVINSSIENVYEKARDFDLRYWNWNVNHSQSI